MPAIFAVFIALLLSGCISVADPDAGTASVSQKLTAALSDLKPDGNPCVIDPLSPSLIVAPQGVVINNCAQALVKLWVRQGIQISNADVVSTGAIPVLIDPPDSRWRFAWASLSAVGKLAALKAVSYIEPRSPNRVQNVQKVRRE